MVRSRRTRPLKSVEVTRKRFQRNIECVRCQTKKWIVLAVAESLRERDPVRQRLACR